MKKLYIILIVVVAAILVGVVIALKLYNKETPQTQNLKTDKSVSVEKITSDFQKDSAKARKTYNNDIRVIDLKGKITRVVPDASGQVHIYFKANHVNIDCLMQKDNTPGASQLKENQDINIKGKYNGYIFDEMIDSVAQLQLNDCIIQK
jgi:Na+-transporting NADH:ubiquinone oxidoreductase subunit NqrC